MERTLLAGALVAVLFLIARMTTHAQSSAPLTTRQQALVGISAYTTKGDLPHLRTALTQGLEAGLTVNEEKEVLVQLYAYCGFPRSLSGINTLMQLLDERKAQGKHDVVGRAASPIIAPPRNTSGASKTWRNSPASPKQAPRPGPTRSARKPTCF